MFSLPFEQSFSQLVQYIIDNELSLSLSLSLSLGPTNQFNSFESNVVAVERVVSIA